MGDLCDVAEGMFCAADSSCVYGLFVAYWVYCCSPGSHVMFIVCLQVLLSAVYKVLRAPPVPGAFLPWVLGHFMLFKLVKDLEIVCRRDVGF